jgi:hypothetical protein
MRIVNFEEFVKLPVGTVYSYWEPEIATGLYRRGDICHDTNGKPIDFYESNLIAWKYYYGSRDTAPFVDLTPGRWGLYDYDQLFVIYEEADIAKIAEGLGIVPTLADRWENHTDFSVTDWKYKVANGDTRLGYVEWRKSQLEIQREESA